jgi:hypothetical protein
MPILDNIRLSQIKEALNYDQNIQRQALDIIKRGVAVMEPEAPENVPYNPTKKEDIELIQELINGFLQLLEKKQNEVDSLIRGKSAQATADNISLVVDVITGYNRLVSALTNPSINYQANITLQTQMMRIQRFIVNIEKMCEKVINGLLVEPRNVQAITFYFIKMLKAYNVYNFIRKQLTSNNLVIITQRDIDNNLNLVIQENLAWFRAIISYRLHAPTYEPIPPGGPAWSWS